MLSAALLQQSCSSLRTRVRVYDRTSRATMPHAGVRHAAQRIAGVAHCTPVLPSRLGESLEQDEHVGASLTKPPQPRSSQEAMLSALVSAPPAKRGKPRKPYGEQSQRSGLGHGSVVCGRRRLSAGQRGRFLGHGAQTATADRYAGPASPRAASIAGRFNRSTWRVLF
jgi:hypothetical protein